MTFAPSTPAGAATQIGQTFTPTVSCNSGTTILQTGSPNGQYVAPFAGVITSWSHQAPEFSVPADLEFKVARSTGGTNFLIVGEDGVVSPGAGLNVYPVRISVQAGDVIGLRADSVGLCQRESSGYSTHRIAGDPPVGTEASFMPFPGFQVDVSANLEPDCDNDGFGDETQDPSVDPACPTPPPEVPPEPSPKADGTLTIDANKGKVEKGRKVTLSGQYDVPSNEACEPGRQIQIQRRLKSEDDSKFQTFATVQTDATGNYSTKVKVKKTHFYRAQVDENASCDDELSNTQKVRVQKRKAAQEA